MREKVKICRREERKVENARNMKANEDNIRKREFSVWLMKKAKMMRERERE